MTSPSKSKGDRAERLAAELLTERTRYTVKRRFGAGQEQDEGDLYGIPGVALQICDWKDKSAALHQKPPQCDEQAKNALAEFGITGIRLRGGDWRWVMTTDTFTKLINRLYP